MHCWCCCLCYDVPAAHTPLMKARPLGIFKFPVSCSQVNNSQLPDSFIHKQIARAAEMRADLLVGLRHLITSGGRWIPNNSSKRDERCQQKQWRGLPSHKCCQTHIFSHLFPLLSPKFHSPNSSWFSNAKQTNKQTPSLTQYFALQSPQATSHVTTETIRHPRRSGSTMVFSPLPYYYFAKGHWNPKSINSIQLSTWSSLGLFFLLSRGSPILCTLYPSAQKEFFMLTVFWRVLLTDNSFTLGA